MCCVMLAMHGGLNYSVVKINVTLVNQKNSREMQSHNLKLNRTVLQSAETWWIATAEHCNYYHYIPISEMEAHLEVEATSSQDNPRFQVQFY